MWIILLDCSGSMGEPFAGEMSFAGRSRASDAEIKLVAAKQALREHLSGLGSPERIALFAFYTAAILCFEGHSNQPELRRAIDALEAGGGTDIAVGLQAAAEYARGTADRIVRVLVISDGLSEAGPAAEAAMACGEAGAAIDVVLIDPTAEGEAVARAIALHGAVSAVTSAAMLSRDVGESAERERTLARQAEEVMAHYQADARAVVAVGPAAERLAFTVGYPSLVEPALWHSMRALIHLAGLEDEVRKTLRQQLDGEHPASASVTSTTATSLIARGTWLRLIPSVEGVEFNPRSQEVAWFEDVQEVPFRFRAAAGVAGAPLVGALEIYVGAMVVGILPLALTVEAGAPEVPLTAASARMFTQVFASYAREDSAVVDACAAAYRALGIYMLIDKDVLQSGEHWNRVLRELIREADVFQLYWSDAASRSKPVEDEWRYALTRAGARSEGFLRPLYWTDDRPSPPPELKHLHFSRLNVDLLSLPQSTPNPAALPGVATTPATAALPVAVVPVLPGAPAELAATVREDVRFAVHFLEEILNLRYYPVPTLLVDDHVVRQVRSNMTVDYTPPHGAEEEIQALGNIVGSIALEFHVRRLTPDRGLIDSDVIDHLFGRGTVLSEEEYDEVRSRAEYFVGQQVRAVLEGETGSVDATRGEIVTALREFSEKLQRLLETGLRAQGDFPVQGSYSVKPGSFQVLGTVVPDHSLRLQESQYASWSDVSYLIHGEFRELVRVFHAASARLIERLAGRGSSLDQPLDRLFVEELATNGVYIPATSPASDQALKHWAFDRHIPTELTLPETPRTLFCVEALDRLQHRLRQEGLEPSAAARLARAFQRSVLMHEHFHAILETGLDQDGHQAAGAALRDHWTKALALNESLAAWMELHAARGNAELSGIVDAFIHAGKYPEWPYRGASVVEAQFAKRGIDAVRELVGGLRLDPVTAQKAFDAMATPNASGPAKMADAA